MRNYSERRIKGRRLQWVLIFKRYIILKLLLLNLQTLDLVFVHSWKGRLMKLGRNLKVLILKCNTNLKCQKQSKSLIFFSKKNISNYHLTIKYPQQKNSREKIIVSITTLTVIRLMLVGYSKMWYRIESIEAC